MSTATNTPSATDLPSTVEELWAHWEAEHAPHPQYAEWRQTATPARITRRVGGGRTFVRAEPGDLVLARTSTATGRVETIAYCPRVGWNVLIGHNDHTPITNEDPR